MSIGEVLAGERSWWVECCDVRQGLAQLPEASVQCVVTSPPYWNLRDYHTGDPRELGHEETPEAYIDDLVLIFNEVRRVLRPDGIAWVNLGHAAAASGRGPTGHNGIGDQSQRQGFTGQRRRAPPGWKAKDLIPLPWLLGLALQRAGWWLRDEVIWHKPAPMPESVQDRCTRSHEYLLMLTKRERYYYDWRAIAEPRSSKTRPRGKGVNPKAMAAHKVPAGWDTGKGHHHGAEGRYERQNASFAAAVRELVEVRRRRSVWRIASEPYRGPHTATFPRELARLCVLAGSRPGDLVLDLFCGTGTTLLVAEQQGRRSLGFELNALSVDDARLDIAAGRRGVRYLKSRGTGAVVAPVPAPA